MRDNVTGVIGPAKTHSHAHQLYPTPVARSLFALLASFAGRTKHHRGLELEHNTELLLLLLNTDNLGRKLPKTNLSVKWQTRNLIVAATNTQPVRLPIASQGDTWWSDAYESESCGVSCSSSRILGGTQS